MDVAHNEHIIRGPEFLEEIPNESYGKIFYRHLQKNYDLPNALVDAITGQSISYKAFFEKSLRLAHSLQKYGVTQNDVIAVSSENSIYYPFPLIAGLWTGATITTYNPQYTTGEITHVALISKPSIVFCSKASLSTILLIQKELKFIKKIILLDSLSSEADVDSLENFIVRNSKDYSTFEPVDIDPHRVALLMYSSGTTGLPKGVMLTGYNLTVTFMCFKDPRYFVRTPPGTTSVLCLMPFSHSFGHTLLSVGLLLGETIVVLSKFEERPYLTAVQNFKIKTLWIVPPIATFLANSKLLDDYDLSHVEEIVSGAAVFSTHLQKLLLRRFKKVSHIRQGYGLTETTIAASISPVHFTKLGSSGKLLPQTIAKVVDINTGRSLGPEEEGEFYIKGPQVMKGYAGDISSTNDVIDSNGWLRTGDIAHYDNDGFIYISDRIKDLIKYKGFQVAPAELETLLLKHPKIADAAVIGILNEVAGEVPLAFIVKFAHQNLTEDDVKNYIAELVSPQKRLRGGVQFVQEIPKSPSGKILRKELRQLLIPKAKL